jgi:hypothetical protein
MVEASGTKIARPGSSRVPNLDSQPFTEHKERSIQLIELE